MFEILISDCLHEQYASLYVNVLYKPSLIIKKMISLQLQKPAIIKLLQTSFHTIY